MPGPTEYIIWFLSFLGEAAVLVCAFRKSALRRYLLLNLYIVGLIASDFGRYHFLSKYGVSSSEYTYFYYYSDAILVILLYFGLSSLYAQVFSEMKAERYVRLGAVLLLCGTALFTYAVVAQSTDRLVVTSFVNELSQNLYFVGLVLTYVLWGAVLKLRETRARLIQLVLSLGVYFSLLAANYAIQNLYPSLTRFSGPMVQIFATFLPWAWAYAFWKLPEEARLVPSRLAVIPR